MSALLETGGMTRLTCGRSYSALAVRVRQPELGYQVALREQGYEPASVDDADYWLAQCFTLPAGCTALCVPLDDGTGGYAQFVLGSRGWERTVDAMDDLGVVLGAVWVLCRYRPHLRTS